MSNLRPGLSRFLSFLLPLVLAAVAVSRADAQIDYRIDQTVWMMLYGVTQAQIESPAWLAGDSDGDGMSNGAELIAGTNPFDPNSIFDVASMSQNATGLVFTFPTQAGKLYSLESTTDLSSTSSWAALVPAVQVEGTGGPMMLAAPNTGANERFYRVRVQDVDSIGDGVSDWAGIITGFYPNTASTGGTANEHSALLADLAMENIITVTATKATATEPTPGAAATDSGIITVTRGGVLLFSTITVPLNWSGTAIPGVDYSSLPASVTIPAKARSVTINVVPMANANLQTGATVTVNICRAVVTAWARRRARAWSLIWPAIRTARALQVSISIAREDRHALSANHSVFRYTRACPP